MKRLLCVALLLLAGHLGAQEVKPPVLPDVQRNQTAKHALVIGNSAYDRQPLRNPVNDANAMSARLRSLGFVVIERNNLRIRQIGSTLREFRSQLKPGAVARAQRSEALRSYPDADGYGRRLRHWER